MHDNISHVTFTGGVDPSNPEATSCNFGDGIMTDNSSNNTITRNTAIHNGPYSGIALVDASTHNTVSDNTVRDQTVANSVPDSDNDAATEASESFSNGTADSDDSGPCGPFGAVATGQGRLHQDIGIRMEGPGAADNVIRHNMVSGSMLDGISIFDNICAGNPFGVTPTPPNSGNLIIDNTSTGNGFAGPGENRDGIAVLEQGPGGVVCVPSDNSIVDNLSAGNARNGIFMAGRGSHNNTIEGNTVVDNGLGAPAPGTLPGDGIHLNGPSTGVGGVKLAGSIDNTIVGNVGHGNVNVDGFDGNTHCDNNNWANNAFVTVNMSCVDPSATVKP